jgi:peptidoglycan/LPS O-acetylase OafA/YrhL
VGNNQIRLGYLMKKNYGYDFIRAFAIMAVFIGHLLNQRSDHQTVSLIIRSISPGLTMSMLGFISGILLTEKYEVYDGKFYIKRFSRIFSSLLICLLTVSVLFMIRSYDVVSQHTILHFMGLSWFFDLFQVENQSPLGVGLWFITIIIGMYLLLPLLNVIYTHRNSKVHLVSVIILCITLDHFMYGTQSAFNVIIAFNIGSYLGQQGGVNQISRKSFLYYFVWTILILSLSGLATINTIPREVRTLLWPAYPLLVIPLFYRIGNLLKGIPLIIVLWFSSISFEVYILHFYFINENFIVLFPAVRSLPLEIFLVMIIVLSLAVACNKVATMTCRRIQSYIIS